MIYGFTGTSTNSDTIDLANVAFSSVTAPTYSSGVLTVASGGTLNFNGNYTGGTFSNSILGNFKFASDGASGTAITYVTGFNGSTGEVVSSGQTLVSLGVTDSGASSDTVTITGLPSYLTNFSFGTYTADTTANNGTYKWSGSAALFNLMTFTAGTSTSTGNYSLTITDSTAGATWPSSGSYSLVIGTNTAISGTGTYTVQNNTTLSSGTISGSPTFNVSTGATLTVNDTTGGTPNFNVSTGAALTINGTISNGTTFNVQDSGTLTINSAASGGTSYTVNVSGTGSTTDSGSTSGGSSITVGGSNTVTLSGAISGGSNITVGDSTQNNPHVTITGTISGSSTTLTVQYGATLDVTTAVSGNPTFTIKDSGTLEFGSLASDSGPVMFASGNTGTNVGTLVLDNPALFTGTISGFTGTSTTDPSQSDKIDLPGYNSATFQENYSTSTRVLTVQDATHTAVGIKFSGTYTSNSFHFQSYSSGTVSGVVIYDPPPATVDSGATVEIPAASVQDVLFANGLKTSGLLVLDDSAQFTGQISGFTGTATSSDAIDLKDINFATAAESYAESSGGTGGTLTVTDGTNTAVIQFTGNYVLGNFEFASDGQGGTLITDPPLAVDQTGVTDNTGALLVNDGATLPLSGTVDNTGTITLASTGDTTKLLITDVTLQGGGHVILSDNSQNIITGTSADATLTNVDNTISGAGHLGDGQLTLVNAGTIIADGNNPLIIDTGANAITNSGTMQSTGAGGLVINSDIANSGLLWADGGNITVHGNVSGAGSAVIDGSAVMEATGANSNSVTFHSATGELILDHSAAFTGTIFGFSGDGTLTGSDLIDLRDISFSSLEQSSYANGVLTVSDGVHTAQLNFDGSYQLANFKFVSDGEGGTTVYDPPVSCDSPPASNDSTKCAPPDAPAATDAGATDCATFLKDTVANFKSDTDKIAQSFSDQIHQILDSVHDADGNAAWTALTDKLAVTGEKVSQNLQDLTTDTKSSFETWKDTTSDHNSTLGDLANGLLNPHGGIDAFNFKPDLGHNMILNSDPVTQTTSPEHMLTSDVQHLLDAAHHDLVQNTVVAADANTVLHDLLKNLPQHFNDFHFV